MMKLKRAKMSRDGLLKAVVLQLSLLSKDYWRKATSNTENHSNLGLS